MITRIAEVSDAKEIADLVNTYAKEDSMLPRTEQEIKNFIEGFVVCVSDQNEFIGCCDSKIEDIT